MKLSALILLPATALAFAPQQPVSLFPTARVSNVALHDVRDDFDDVVKKIEDTTEDYVGKADELVINRGMRLANHFPALVTLKALADKAGMSASINGGIVAVSSQLLQCILAICSCVHIFVFVCVRPMLSSLLIGLQNISLHNIFFRFVHYSRVTPSLLFLCLQIFLSHNCNFSIEHNRRPRHLVVLALPFRSPPGASMFGLLPLWLS